EVVGKSRSRKAMGSDRPGVEGSLGEPSTAEVPADLLAHLWRFRNQFRDGRDAEKVLRAALRLGLDVFHASEGCVASVRPGGEEARVVYGVPPDGWWDRAMLAGFLRGEKVRIPHDLMLARIRRHGRMWGALAVRSPGTDYRWDARQALSSIGATA